MAFNKLKDPTVHEDLYLTIDYNGNPVWLPLEWYDYDKYAEVRKTKLFKLVTDGSV